MTTALEVAATGHAAEAVTASVPGLVADRVASRLFARDPSLWGPGAEEEAGRRLAWVDLPRSSRHLVGQVSALREELGQDGIDRVVLCGMGGSSLAAEVICAAHDARLTVLDSSQPDLVRTALEGDLQRTVTVVSSKSGSTLETDSHRRAFEEAYQRAGLSPTAHMVFVTDPDSPMEADARRRGFRVVRADPGVGGRYSALTAFGLVPSGLAGVDVEHLLDDAESVRDLLASDDEANPALRLGAALATTEPLRDKLALVDDGSGLTGFPGWAEQLIAESTGKDGTGLLPVVVTDTAAPEVGLPPHDVTVVRIQPDADLDENETGSDISVTGPLAAQFLLWECATAVAGRLLGVNPFDQPDVERAKQAARDLLDEGVEPGPTDVVDKGIEARARGEGFDLGGSDTVEDAIEALLARIDPDAGYLAVMAYLDRHAHAGFADVRRRLALRTRRPTTFGWGPRFLHSTGQLHKGGPREGVFLQVTTEPVADLEIPGLAFTFGDLVAAQASGDAGVLADLGRPVLRLHLRDPVEGLKQLDKALR